MSERYFCYVPHALVERALKMGWENIHDLGPPHSNYAVLMEWTKDDDPIMPQKGDKHEEAKQD